eukprot:9529519-Alexandrium_andersonii.AAC.1
MPVAPHPNHAGGRRWAPLLRRAPTCPGAVRRANGELGRVRTLAVAVALGPVSYTHLTLPTICSV